MINYPTGFTLTAYDGSNYTRSGITITPAANFTGTLNVPVSVNDGEDESAQFALAVEVVAPQNVAPQISGQVPITIIQGQSTTIALSQLTVSDPDDSLPPQDSHLQRNDGEAITRVAEIPLHRQQILPEHLNVPVSVMMGEDESAQFTLAIGSCLHLKMSNQR
jgi:hypothetical protein